MIFIFVTSQNHIYKGGKQPKATQSSDSDLREQGHRHPTAAELWKHCMPAACIHFPLFVRRWPRLAWQEAKLFQKLMNSKANAGFQRSRQVASAVRNYGPKVLPDATQDAIGSLLSAAINSIWKNKCKLFRGKLQVNTTLHTCIHPRLFLIIHNLCQWCVRHFTSTPSVTSYSVHHKLICLIISSRWQYGEKTQT